MVLEHNSLIKLLKASFSQIAKKRKTNEIYIESQIYDSYSKIQEIFKEANKKIIIIENYVDNTFHDNYVKPNIELGTGKNNNLNIKNLFLLS